MCDDKEVVFTRNGDDEVPSFKHDDNDNVAFANDDDEASYDNDVDTASFLRDDGDT